MVSSRWLDTLKEEESKHNTAAALRVRDKLGVVGPEEKPKTPNYPTDKTDKTFPGTLNFPDNAQNPTDKTDINTEAGHLGLISTWSFEFGYVSIHDPNTGEWHDLPTKEAPDWAVGEARRRKVLYKDGNRRAYRLTSREMGEVWEAEQVNMWETPGMTDRGIVYEDYLEED